MQEVVIGLAASAPIALKGGAVIRMTLVDISKKKSKEILVRVKICAKGSSDFGGIILGGRALDCAERGGLGHRTTDKAHVLDGLGIMLPRNEKPEPFVDKAYMMRDMVRIMSAFDALDSVKEPLAPQELLFYDGPGESVEPGEGTWIPVKRLSGTGANSDPCLCEIVTPVSGPNEPVLLEASPGLWPTGAETGFVFVANPKEGNEAYETKPTKPCR